MRLFGSSPPVTVGFIMAQIFMICFGAMIARASLNFRDISDALAFYGVYHREPMNQLIHFFGVPGILWTALIFGAHLPLPLVGQTIISFLPLLDRHQFTWATLFAAWYILFYIKIDPFGGSLYALVVYGYYVTAVRLVEKDQKAAQKKQDEALCWTGTGKMLQFALVVHALSWLVQIHPGHSVFEGAKPAIMQSVGGALSSAPLFAFYEGLWLLGINKPLQEQTQQLVAEYTAELCAAGATMRACASI